jgi:hypothetical protein
MPISEKMRTRILEGDNTMQLAEQAAKICLLISNL